MTNLILELTTDTILGNYDSLRAKAKSERRTTIEPLAYAVAGLLVVSGNNLEVGGYRALSNHETRMAKSLFGTAVTGVANQLLQAHPNLADEVLEHEVIKPFLANGPLKRLSKSDQALKSLRGLLADPYFFSEYEKRDLFNWDDGSAHTAIGIAYCWRKVVTNQRGIFQPISHIHHEGRLILREAQSTYPQNQILELVNHRAELGWASQINSERQLVLNAIDTLVPQAVEGEQSDAARLIKLLFLVDAGLRFRESGRVQVALAEIQEMIVPHEPTHPRIMIEQIWAEALAGNTNQTRQLISTIESEDVSIRADIVQILNVIGDVTPAKIIFQNLSPEFRPSFGSSLMPAIEN